MSEHQMKSLTEKGVLFAADTLYSGEKTFEWFNVLSFLPETRWPSPLSASQLRKEEGQRLALAFTQTVEQVTADDAQSDGLLQVLCAYSPSVRGLHELLRHVHEQCPAKDRTVARFACGRIKTLHFGADDKREFKDMAEAVPLMRSDEVAVGLLSNAHHPSEAFPPSEVIQFVGLVSRDTVGVRLAGQHLQHAARSWLRKLCSRERKDEKPADGKLTQAERHARREETRRLLNAWHLVLSEPCFHQQEDALRDILLDLSQCYVFKDAEPLDVVGCILALETDVQKLASVKSLQDQVVKIAIKASRDAQEASEELFDKQLARLLFQEPTPLRFTIVEAFVGWRRAKDSLDNMLNHVSLWNYLLSGPWLKALESQDHPLAKTQQGGKRALTEHAAQLRNSTIQLQHLRTILRHQKDYEALVKQITGSQPDNITASGDALAQFDAEFRNLRTYVKLFCSIGSIDKSSLEQLVGDVKENEQTMPLKEAVKKFEKLAVRQHLPWFWPLRESDVFLKIWEHTAQAAKPAQGPLTQEAVVDKVIPEARKTWEALALSLEQGSALLKDIQWCIDLEWSSVKLELERLESTTTSESGAPWAAQAFASAEAARLAAKLCHWAPAMQQLRNALAPIFKQDCADPCAEELKQMVSSFGDGNYLQYSFGGVLDAVGPFRATINKLSEPMQDYTLQLAKHEDSLTWLLKNPSTEDFNRLISLCRPNTDNSVILAAIASLQQTRTFLAQALYGKEYDGILAFLSELALLTMDSSTFEALVSVQKSFDPMLDLLTTHSRTPGVQACYDLKRIHERGTFSVICSVKESEQLQCKTPEGELNYESLAELRRQLLMTDLPAELEGATNLPAMLEELVNKLQLLEEYGRCTMELFTLGHFAYHSGQVVLNVSPEQTAAELEVPLQSLQQRLADWQVTGCASCASSSDLCQRSASRPCGTRSGRCSASCTWLPTRRPCSRRSSRTLAARSWPARTPRRRRS